MDESASIIRPSYLTGSQESMYVRSADKLVGISAVFPECEVVLMKLQGKLSTAAKQLTSSHSVTATEIYPSKVETSHSTTKSHQNSELNFYF